MIEGIPTVELPERFFRVTLAAILSKLVVVHILVAVNTVVKLQPIELLEFFSVAQAHFMTAFAVGFTVLAKQNEFRIVVIKSCCRFESLVIVTLKAVFGEALLVMVLVTTQALGV